MRRRTFLMIVVSTVAGVIVPAQPAKAHALHCGPHRVVKVKHLRRHGHRVTVRRCVSKPKPAPKPAPLAPATQTPSTVPAGSVPAPVMPLSGMGNIPGCAEGGDPAAYVREQGGSIVRVIVNPWTAESVLSCAQAAASEGFRVLVDVQWWNAMSPPDAAQFVDQELQAFGRYAWAISIGNEQELTTGGPAYAPSDYASVWRAVQPVLAAYAPGALRVAGEVTPWGTDWLEQAMADGLPGVQAVAVHPYPYSGVANAYIPQVVNWAHGMRLQAWFTESLCGPGNWYEGDCWSLDQARAMGAQVALEWHG